MKNLLLICFTALISLGLNGQAYTTSSIFAHNDYAQPFPLQTAYNFQVGYIEVDILLEQNELLVAHSKNELDKNKTIEGLYLKPLQVLLEKNKGNIYPDSTKTLFLMIDLKTEATPTLDLLVKKLKKYTGLISCRELKITISGNMPKPAEWENYPDFIHFDGRPGIDYSEDQLKRVGLISASFAGYSQWNGKGVLTKTDREKLVPVIQEAHKKGKKIRFWGTPDFNNAWIKFMQLGVDILNSDRVVELAAFLKEMSTVTYQNNQFHTVYQPLIKQIKDQSKAKNIILMIGDGMGLSQLYSGYTANRGQLNIFNISNIGFSVTYASDSYITDSAAGASAMASGKKTNNRFVGLDSLEQSITPISQSLKRQGYNIGVISSGDVTDATPAAFYAHQPERSLSEAIANDFLTSDIDLLLGSGAKSFKNRKDGRNLFVELRQKGYSVSETVSSIDSIRSTKVVILDGNAGASMMKGRGDFLSKAVSRSARVLSADQKPFFIMAEGAQIDWGGHANNLEYVVTELLDFDKAVGEAMKFVDDNKETLLIITADHETGGLSLIGGDLAKGYVHGSFSTTDHTGVMVPVFAYGPGSDLFRGVYQNTDIHTKMLEAVRLNQQ